MSHGQQEKPMNRFWKSWSKKKFASKCKDKEITLLRSHHKTQLFRKGYYPRNLIRKEEKRKTKDNMVRQHHSVDRYRLRKSIIITEKQAG